ncbi:EAL domain-containing protein [Shewanella holmiensis]|uniref:cyclic-guanylate-specific phosphodiesterase n=1 Tax=Shewanella holmiensis TaxID=2952222 RepID=A0A9X2WPC6_9GAMM|nr:EAL domain-containing protein [Shewanella holmiensis]MCT7942893.1 EAL domain-containing protein [Shewanella holmiensis]
MTINSSISLKLFIQVITLATIYFVLGIAGLELAMPPGYATAIFPAAGIAVSAILYGGIRLLPGVWLGSFFLNLWVAGSSEAFEIQSVFIALLIAIGASIQALVALYLVNISQINWKALTTFREIVLFLTLASPLASLASSTWANITLYLFGIISTDYIASSWLNWWIGDTTGVLLFAPIALILLYRDKVLAKYRLRTVIIPTLLSLLMVFPIFFYVASSENHQIKNRMQNTGIGLEHHIKSKLIGFTETVISLSNLMQMYPDLTFTKFESYTRELFTLHPDLHGIGWNKYFSAPERANFETQLAKHLNMPTFQITEKDVQGNIVRAEIRDHYAPITYISPFEPNKKALGYDIASDPVRFKAITQVLQTGQLAITSPIKLVQDTEPSTSILVIAPVNNTLRDAISGFAVASVRIENMMHFLFSQGLMEDIEIRLEDKHALNTDKTLFSSHVKSSSTNQEYQWQTDIDFGGRTWQLTLIPTGHYIESHLTLLAWQILLIGLLFSGLLQILLLTITGQHYLAKTALQQSESSIRAILDNAPFLIWQKDTNGHYLNINKKLAVLLELTDASQILGKTDFDIWPKELAEHYQLDDEEVLSTQTTKHIEQEPVIEGGQTRYTETFKSPLIDSFGKLVGTIGFSHDISEKIKAREALKANETTFKAMIESIPVAVYVSSDVEQVATYINPTFTKLFGYTIDEVPSAATWWPLAYPDKSYRDQISEEWLLKVDQAIKAQSDIEPMEVIVTCKDGSKKNILWGFTTLNDQNFAFGLNLTELRHAENIVFESEVKFKSLIQNMSEGLALHELVYDENNQAIDYRILEVNRAFEAQTGITSINASGKLATEVYGLNPAPFLENYAQVVKTGKPYSFEVYFEPLQRHFNISVFSPMANQFATVFTDITERKKVQQQIVESESRFRELFQQTPIAYQSLDAEGRFIDANEQLCDMLGYSREEILGITFGEIWMDEIQDQFPCQFKSFKKAGHVSTQLTLEKRDGQLITVILNGRIQRDTKGNFVKTHCVLIDITEREKIAQEMRIAAIAFESQEGMFVTDVNGIILRANQSFTAITGYEVIDVIGKKPRMFSSGRHDENFYSAMWKSINTTGAWQGEVWNKRKNGQIYPEHLSITAVMNNQHQVTHYVATLTDITANKAAENEIHALAFHDPLTKLPNRRLFMDRLSQALALSARTAHKGALLFLDIDHFKTLNDTLGHELGDVLLQQVADRLQETIREHDTVARLGGDEFVVLLESLHKDLDKATEDTKQVANKILSSLSQTYQLEEHEYHSSCSIGVIMFSDHDISPEVLIKHADIAMYQAKHDGRNAICIFNPKMQDQINARSTLENDIRRAISGEQFQLYYQVQVDKSNRPLGAEALIRWHHPERGLVSPIEFISLAEETGLIIPIGEWVLNSACAQLKLWQQQEHMCDFMLSINVSAKQFHQPDFAQKVQSIIEPFGINPQRLKFELTESMLLQNLDATIQTMLALKKFGVQFSLDDFGTGYSSLQYLKRLPLDQLKIDQSFVRDVVVEENDRAIVRTIIAMADSLGLDIIAEGVETEQQRDILLAEGCCHYQGYLFSKPIPIDEFEANSTTTTVNLSS